MVSLDYSSASAPTGVALLLGERPIDHRVTDRNVRRRDSDLSDNPAARLRTGDYDRSFEIALHRARNASHSISL
jgi:hypothetical protein